MVDDAMMLTKGFQKDICMNTLITLKRLNYFKFFRFFRFVNPACKTLLKKLNKLRQTCMQICSTILSLCCKKSIALCRFSNLRGGHKDSDYQVGMTHLLSTTFNNCMSLHFEYLAGTIQIEVFMVFAGCVFTLAN